MNIVKSKGVVFLEDQFIDDGNKGESSSFFAEILINLDSIPPLIRNTNQGEDVQEDGDDIGNDEAPPVKDAELVGEAKQSLPVPLITSAENIY